PALHRIMQDAAAALRAGNAMEPELEKARAAILAAGFRSIEYLELRSVDGLKPVASFENGARMLFAGWLGDVRLIDNIAV
ncbi:MAG: pantoate--beta-alanine ligase, partial [Rhodobacteraceae bacterium]|nr:pantoate--beta-alanine ligase [Paracoccaceae bacterium]